MSRYQFPSAAITDASLLVSGTLADARLSSNVALENVANVFSAKQSFSGTTHSGLCLHSLTTSEYNALTPANGDLYRDSTADRIDARLNRGTVELVDTAGGQTIGGTLTATALSESATAATGTGGLVRAASPTMTGTANVASLTASGTVIAQTALRIGTAGANSPYFFPFTAAAHTNPNAAGRGFTFYSYVSETNSTSIAFSGEVANQTSGNSTNYLVQRNYSPTSGTGVYNLSEFRNTVNQTGGANGITRGLFINPTLTAAADFRAIDVGNCGSHTAIRTGTGLVSFGDSVTITGTTRLGTFTVGTLPSAAANTRARAFVTDSNLAFNSTNLGSTVTAGGAILVPVFSDGTNWVIG